MIVSQRFSFYVTATGFKKRYLVRTNFYKIEYTQVQSGVI